MFMLPVKHELHKCIEIISLEVEVGLD
jgi:hypothetical protein